MNNRPYKTNTSNRELENETHLTNIANVPEPASYKEGYVHGRASERSVEKQHEEVRTDNIAARGLLLGVALTSLVGVVVGLLFYLSQRQETPQPVPVISPNISQPQNRETTVIERTTENTQESSSINPAPPTTPQNSQQNIRIVVPNTGQQQAPAPQSTTPQTAPTQPERPPIVDQPSVRQPNTLPQSQTSTGTSTTTQPTTTNQTSPTQLQSQTSTGTSTRTQPNTINQTSPEQTQNQTQQPNTSDSVQ